MNEYNIFGAIVDSDMDKFSADDITLADFNDFINSVQDGDEVTFVFNSPGGSVTSGIAIANKIKALSNRGIKTTAKVEGVCASISTCIACACDKIVMGKGSFFMIHNCWSVVQGDCNTLRKEADLMEKMNEAILSFYRSKFNATDEQLKQWMDDETWISSEDVNDFGLICEVDDNEIEFKIAASINRYDFKHIPEVLNMTNEKEILNEDNVTRAQRLADEVLAEMAENFDTVKEDESSNEDKPTEEEEKEVEVSSEEEKTPDVQDEEKVETPFKQDTEDDTTNEPTEEPKEEDEVLNKDEVLAKFAEYEKQIEELKQANEELQKKLDECEKVEKDECEKRISGVQSSFQHKINDLTEQFNIKDKELMTAKGEISSLNEKLEKSQKELSEMVASLEEKTLALASLNAAVNAPSEELPTMKDGLAKCATPAEKVAFLRAGRFVR